MLTTRRSYSSPGILFALIVFAFPMSTTGCTFLLDFEECATHDDCGASGVCSDGICDTPSCTTTAECESFGPEYSCINQRCFQLDTSMCTLDPEFEPQDGPILHIGLLFPFTGRNEQKAKATSAAAKTAFRQINLTHDGVRGVKLAGLECDTEQNSERAVEVAEYMVDEVGIQSTVGSISSGETLAVTDVTIPAGVAVISPASTSPAITGLEDDDLVWRTIPSDALQGPALANIVLDGGYENVAVFNVESAYGQGLFNAFIGTDGIDSDGIISLTYQVDDSGDLVADSVVEKATDAFGDEANKPDAILVMGSLESQQLIFALDDTFFGDDPDEEKPQWILSEAGRDPGLLEPKFSAVWDRISGTVIEPPDTPIYDAFKLRYQSDHEFVAEENPFADKAYDAAFLLGLAHGSASDPLQTTGADVARALAKTASGDRFAPGDDLAAALNKLQSGIDYQGASGPVDFDEKGDVESDIAQWRIDTSGAQPTFETVGVVFDAR